MSADKICNGHNCPLDKFPDMKIILTFIILSARERGIISVGQNPLELFYYF